MVSHLAIQIKVGLECLKLHDLKVVLPLYSEAKGPKEVLEYLLAHHLKEEVVAASAGLPA